MQKGGDSDQARTWLVSPYAVLFLWIAIIFFLSSPEGSASQTSRIIGPLLHLIFPGILPETEAVIHAVVRKCAHFTEYAILATLAVRAFSTSASIFIKQRTYVLACALVILVAALDEFNQSFEASRTSSIWDVLLDILGGTTALSAIILWNIRRRKN